MNPEKCNFQVHVVGMGMILSCKTHQAMLLTTPSPTPLKEFSKAKHRHLVDTKPQRDAARNRKKDEG